MCLSYETSMRRSVTLPIRRLAQGDHVVGLRLIKDHSLSQGRRKLVTKMPVSAGHEDATVLVPQPCRHGLEMSTGLLNGVGAEEMTERVVRVRRQPQLTAGVIQTLAGRLDGEQRSVTVRAFRQAVAEAKQECLQTGEQRHRTGLVVLGAVLPAGDREGLQFEIHL